MNLWDLIASNPALFAILYVVTLVAAMFTTVGIQHEHTKRELAWANAETTEAESKVQVASLALEQTKTLAAAHEQYHQAHDVGHAGMGIFPHTPN